ncbi:MAG: ParA family protein [Patescibacteria group bacterium]
MSTVISVTNQKGGVGKTTTSVNLGAALAKSGYKVLIIDLDPQGHSGEHLGVQVIQDQKGPKTILDVLNHERELLDTTYPTYIPNLWLIPSNLKLGQFNQNSPSGRQFNLKTAITPHVNRSFDFIFIDCQPSLSLLTLNALTSCNQVILPVQAEFLALDGLTQLVMTLKEIQTKLHPKLQVLGILLTMYDKRNRLSGEVRAELEKNFGQDLFSVSIPRVVKIAESPSFGQSIFDYDPKSPGASAYQELAKEVISRVGTK